MEAVQARGTERLLLRIGAISATSRAVLTPSGSAPVNDVRWTVKEEVSPRSRVWRRAVPGGGATGSVQLTVTVHGPGWQHTEAVGPVTGEEVAAVRAKVTQARMLALRAVVWCPVATVPASGARVREKVAAPRR